MTITRAPEYPQGSEFDQNHPTMSPTAPAQPRGPNLETLLRTFGWVIQVHNSINRGLVQNPGGNPV